MMFYVLTLIVAASRFLPHPPNVACVGAIGLFAGCYLAGRRAYLVPAAVLLISDVTGQVLGVPGMGFYSPVAMIGVYGGATMAVVIGRRIQSGGGIQAGRAAGGSLAASTAFFLLSNLGVFLSGWYSMSIAGLISCYAFAIPFFGYTIAGDLVFTAILFGAWQFSGASVGQSSQLSPGSREV